VEQGLTLAPEITDAMAAIRSEEASRLAKWEYETTLANTAAEAHAREDVDCLQKLVSEAKSKGCDPSAALAALASLTGEVQNVDGGGGATSSSAPIQGGPEEKEPEEEELERLYVSSPNGQSHCFGMYVLVPEERGNGFPV